MLAEGAFVDEIQQCLETWSRARQGAVGRAAGEEAAKRLFAEWGARIRYLTSGMSPDDRDDCLQDAVVKAVCGRNGSEPAALAPPGYTPAQWRNAVLRNAVKDFKRGRGRRAAVVASVLEGRSPKLHAALQAAVRAAREAERAHDYTVEAPDLKTPTRDPDDMRRSLGAGGEVEDDALAVVQSAEVASLRRDQVLDVLGGMSSPSRVFYVALRLGFDTTPWHVRVAEEWAIPVDDLVRRLEALGGGADLSDQDLARLRFGVVTPQGVESEGKMARRGITQLTERLHARYGGER